MAGPINILLIGGGGREHALAWKLRQSPRCGKLWLTDSRNPALQKLGTPVDVPVSKRELYRLKDFCEKKDIGLVVIGPEDPLAEGFADALAAPNRRVFGPNAEAAKLEADKAWSKDIMRAAAIPTADARSFSDFERALKYLQTRDEEQVIKAAGLAKGKGVIVPPTLEEAEKALHQIMVERVFGDAGSKVIIEERLEGPEASVLAILDGKSALVLPTCQDHKRLADNDTGPNTGGMGAFSPSSALTDDTLELVEQEVLLPLMDTFRREEIEYRGVLYAGLMLTPSGPKVLEFNVRFGDPECQPLMMRMKGDLVDLMLRACDGNLDGAGVEWDDRPSCCVVLASHGYPDSPRKGDVIEGIDKADALDDVVVFQAGTATDASGRAVTSGGRVLGVTALGDTLADASERAYEACDLIDFAGKTFRRDIGRSVVPS